MKIHPAICAVAFAMILPMQPRLKERKLDDVAVISLPAGVESMRYEGYSSELAIRRPFQFSSKYTWASLFGPARWKQLIVVSVMAPDATDADYAEKPRAINMLYEQIRQGKPSASGPGILKMTEGMYALGVERVPAVEYLYYDKARRLQIAWHAVSKEVDQQTALALIARMAESFRLLRDPVATYAEQRAVPVREAADRASKLATVKEMLQREGYGSLQAGKPVLRNGVYLEWMDEPEPRYQLLVPLGQVRAAVNGSVVNRPRPTKGGSALAGSIGWREVDDGEWRFYNDSNDYLPLTGVGQLLAKEQQDPAFVYFYYVATVRVEEESDERLLTSLKWFLDGVPEVQRRWREGTLVTPGKPELPPH